MQEVASKGRQVSAERAAIMAAISLAHESLAARNQGGDSAGPAVDNSAIERKVDDMVQRATDAIDTHQNALF